MAIIAEGMADARRTDLLALGSERFGPPDESVRASLNGITDHERLGRMMGRILHVSSWQALLAIP